CAGSMERRPKAERLAAERIGLVAGSGRFPVLFAETARRRGVEVVAVAHLGETDPALERVVSAITWIHPGELDAMIHALQTAGFRAAKVIGQFDIGQSVVVRSGAVIAVEGIEGTDATIRRAGQLANGDIVVVKVCKPTQDTRFDLPAVGPETVRTLAEMRGRALAVEAGRTITL